METDMRLAHSRFYHGKSVRKSEEYDRIVTSCWSFQPDTSILTYGSTVYRRTDDHWNKKAHKLKAIERYKKHPIRVRVNTDAQLDELSNIAMDWYIAKKLIFVFGTHNENEIDVRRVHGNCTIHSDFNDVYTCLKDTDNKSNKEDYYEMDSFPYLIPILGLFGYFFGKFYNN